MENKCVLCRSQAHCVPWEPMQTILLESWCAKQIVGNNHDVPNARTETNMRHMRQNIRVCLQCSVLPLEGGLCPEQKTCLRFVNIRMKNCQMRKVQVESGKKNAGHSCIDLYGLSHKPDGLWHLQLPTGQCWQFFTSRWQRRATR